MSDTVTLLPSLDDTDPKDGIVSNNILSHPRPVESSFSHPDPDALPPAPAFLARTDLAAYMRRHSLRPRLPDSNDSDDKDDSPTHTSGDLPSMASDRRPFAGQITTFALSSDPDTTIDLKRCGTAENLQRQNMASKIRYLDDGVERDVPMGSLKLDTVMLSAVGWNITDGGKAVPFSAHNLQKYLSPAEFDEVYAEVLRINPIWGGGEAETKND